MKHAKKLVFTNKRGFIPDVEYGFTDPLKKDKIETDKKISKALKNPKYSQLEKHVKYQALNRKRKRLIKQIDDKPLKVIIDSKQEKITPTTGIETKIQTARKIIADKVIENAPQEKENLIAQEKEIEAGPSKQPKKFEDYLGIINKNKYNQLAEYVYENRAKYGILETGQFYKNKSESLYPVQGLTYRDVLKYITGEQEIDNNKKNAASILLRRFFRDEEVKNMVEQKGEGKLQNPRYIMDMVKHIKNSKTKGLTRKFRPTLWTKIPV